MAASRPDRPGSGVVFATFVTLGLVYGFWYSYAVLLVAFLREFGWSRSLVAGVFSVLVLVHGASGPYLGWLSERVGPRRLILAGAATLAAGLVLAAETTRVWHLYASIGVVAALGMSSAGWVPSVALVRGWFPARVGTALGIASAGIGVGIFAMVPLTQWLIDWAGWRWALRLVALGVVCWVLPATAWLVRDPPLSAAGPSRSDERAPATASWTLRAATRSWRFWGVAGVLFCGSSASQMLLIHQVAYLVDHGISSLAAASVVGVVGLASIVGKTGWGTLSDRVGREPAYTAALGCVVASVGALALAGRFPGSPMPYVYAVLIGVGYAATAPLTPAVASDLFGGPRFARIFGTLNVANSLGGAFGAWAAGQIFDRTRSYAVALSGAAVLAGLAPALLWVVAPRRPNPPPAAR